MTFDWQYAISLLAHQSFWEATLTVIGLSVSSWLISVVCGFLLALGKQSAWPWLSSVCGTYVWLFRSLPLLVLLIFIYNLPQVWPWMGRALSDPFVAGLLAMSISESAYMAEIHRGGLSAVAKGQFEAGRALGIGYFGMQRLILLPQAFRVALPSLINEYITIVKLTSLVSVISLAEILLVGERLYTQNFKVLETMLAVAFYYVLIVTVFGLLLGRVEKRLDVTRRLTSLADAIPPGPGAIEGDTPAAARVAAHRLAIEAIGVHKRYGDHHVLKGIDLRVTAGEVISIIGPSGSGKTSLIRTLNGLETLDDGEVRLHGEPFLWPATSTNGRLPRAQYQKGIVNIGMVFQSFNLFPHRTVLDNVTLAPAYHGRLEGIELAQHGLKILGKVGLQAHACKYPHQLSGGQQQRVAIARALAMEPAIVLFDEPTSALDPELVGEVLKVIEALANEGMTMIVVTHEIDFAMRISDRVVFMDGGLVAHDMPPSSYALLDRDARVSRFLKGHRADNPDPTDRTAPDNAPELNAVVALPTRINQ
jgi:polar amino acid transport system permease protein